ncbi:MAG: hypothetical protein ABIH99_05540 [Candidatus Micrarchaeota archaeon]
MSEGMLAKKREVQRAEGSRLADFVPSKTTSLIPRKIGILEKVGEKISDIKEDIAGSFEIARFVRERIKSESEL